LNRRDFLWGAPALVAGAARGQDSSPAPVITQYEAASGGRIGFYARNIRTRQTMSWRSDERFVMCSTFKASLASLILHRVDQHQDDLEALIAYGPSDMQDWYAPVAKANLAKGVMTVQEMCAAAVQHSDNTCASLLLTRVGGPLALTAFWRRLGDVTTRLDDAEPLLNRTPLGGVRDTTTPRAMAEILQKLVLGDVLSAGSRRTLVAWLVGNTTGDNRLRAGLPTTWITGDKTGNNGKDAAGDIAVTWGTPTAPIIIAAYTRGGTPTAAQFEAVFRDIGRLVSANLA